MSVISMTIDMMNKSAHFLFERTTYLREAKHCSKPSKLICRYEDMRVEVKIYYWVFSKVILMKALMMFAKRGNLTSLHWSL